MTTLSRRSALALGSGALFVPSALRAQATWPTQPLSFVVGYAAGGGADIVARELAHLMTPLLGQQVIVENKGGAAGAIGARFVSNAKPDGYTIFYAVGTNVVTNPHVLKSSIDTLKGLVPIIQTTDYQYVLAVNPNVPANNVKELIALAKKEPGKLTYSSSGVGGNNHLAGALFAEAAGIQITHAPYKGTGPALMDVISGVITMNFSSLPPAVGQIKSGRLKALAVTGEKRVSSLPDVPTLKEQGVDVAVTGWHGLFAPPKTPDAILDRLHKETTVAMKEAKYTEALAKDGLELPPARSRADFTKYVHDEHAFWGKKLKALNVQAE
ncbi:tripartite tricarboxylate transporter substrate binding protein [Reyranella sp.]|uniref:Bug family tripartite tricarboxylate transporter substrate binding protein n=1 Tax=Reyranella sp. TaxID=1929291 RepID=UPI0011FC71A1|nr:tripartite tricarboxylate transporter substrate binding protein [Reyranella sp.]TAJ84728.1 MAG: tripartite tricarboxylate transporter substrate binding protein [Reyranella sp.]